MPFSRSKFGNLVKEVTAEKINQDIGGGTLLYHACDNSWVDETDLLLQRGAIPSVSNPNTPPPIWIAAKTGCLKTVKLLREYGADINQCYDFVSPLMIAVEHRKKKVIPYLLEHGADTELRDTESKTVLHRTCKKIEKGRTMITQWLVNAKADVNALASNGETPTMFAAKKGNIETLKILVKGGADINIVSKYGTAYDYAANKRHKLTLKYLTKRMGLEEQKKDGKQSQAKMTEVMARDEAAKNEARMADKLIDQVQIICDVESENIFQEFPMNPPTTRQEDMMEQETTQEDVTIPFTIRKDNLEIQLEDIRKLHNQLIKCQEIIRDTLSDKRMKNDKGIV